MYFHIGNNNVVRLKDLVGVFDMDNTTISRSGRKFLGMAKKRGEIVEAAGDSLPRSYVVTEKGGKVRVYISALSSQTLLKRANAGAAAMK